MLGFRVHTRPPGADLPGVGRDGQPGALGLIDPPGSNTTCPARWVRARIGTQIAEASPRARKHSYEDPLPSRLALSPRRRQAVLLVEHGHEVINPALDDDDFDQAVRTGQAEYDRHRPDVIVGSSRGGAVAMNLDSGSTPLVLFCPAWKRWGTATKVKPGTVILHGEADDVIPIAESRELIPASGLPESTFVVVGSDHRLADPEPLAAMDEGMREQGRTDRPHGRREIALHNRRIKSTGGVEQECMNEPPPANPCDDAINPIVVYRFIGLFLLAAISGSFGIPRSQLAWPWFAVSFFIGAIAGILVGFNFGVHTQLTVATMAVVAGFLEGIYQGWKAYGLVGAVLGGPAGVLAGVVLIMLTLISITVVSTLCGRNPFVSVPEESLGAA